MAGRGDICTIKLCKRGGRYSYIPLFLCIYHDIDQLESPLGVDRVRLRSLHTSPNDGLGKPTEDIGNLNSSLAPFLLVVSCVFPRMPFAPGAFCRWRQQPFGCVCRRPRPSFPGTKQQPSFVLCFLYVCPVICCVQWDIILG